MLDALPAPRRELDAREQQLDQLLPVALRAVDLLELQRRGQVLRVELQDALVDVARAVAVADLVFPHRRRLQQHFDLAARRRRATSRLLLEHVDALFPARLLREQLLERAERAEVALVERSTRCHASIASCGRIRISPCSAPSSA